MGTEKVARDAVQALNEIKDKGVMLSMAKEYLCEEPFLKKTGTSIEKDLRLVKTHIEHIKRRFVGKPPEDFDLDERLERVSNIAKLLKKSEKSVRMRCSEGALGKELGEGILFLTRGIKDLEKRVEGLPVTYTTMDSIVLFLSKLRSMYESFASTFKLAFKILALFIMVCVAAFGYLVLTMETENSMMKKIDHTRTQIREGEETLITLTKQLEAVRKEIKRIEESGAKNPNKVKLMELDLNAYKLADQQEKTQAELVIHQKALQARLDGLEELRNKSFLERILRQ